MLIGLDLAEDIIQLAFYKEESKRETETRVFPTKFAFLEQEERWLFGDEAVRLVERGEALLLPEDFLSKLCEGRPVEVSSKSFEASFLLEKMMGCLLQTCDAGDEVFLVIAVKKIDKVLHAVFLEAMGSLGLLGRYSLINYEEAFFYFTLAETFGKKLRNAAMFELDEEGLRLSFLEIEGEEPGIGKIAARYRTENITRKLVAEEVETAEGHFLELAKMALQGREVSLLVATGRGFVSGWADKVLKRLSHGKKGLCGQDLFALGALYSVKQKKEAIFFYEEDRLMASLSILANRNGSEEEVELIKPSMYLHELEVTRDLLLKGEAELSIRLFDILSKKTTSRFLSFPNLHLKENEVTRLRLHIRFKNKETCIIKVIDLGFGSFLPTTNRVWELTWEM